MLCASVETMMSTPAAAALRAVSALTSSRSGLEVRTPNEQRSVTGMSHQGAYLDREDVDRGFCGLGRLPVVPSCPPRTRRQERFYARYTPKEEYDRLERASDRD